MSVALQRVAGVLALLSAALLIGTSALGPSAASPSLGPATALPPYALGVGASSGLVTVLLVVAYLAGGTAVALGLWAAHRGAVVPRSWLVAAGCVAAAAVLVPPLGSADHLSYAAYGRIAVQGGDPYVVPPVSWAGGLDPVTSAVEDPWTRTPSVYGPVATGVQALTSLVGGDSLRLTVWLWQLVCLASWLAVWVLLRRRGRSRGAWLWLLNPVLLGLLVVGAHVDVLAAALGLGALVLLRRRPLLAGVLLGASVGVKLTFGLLAPAIVYALWRNRSGWRPLLLGLAGAAVVLVPSYVVAGPHAFDQLGQARRFVSLATPWRLLVDAYAARGLVLLVWPMVAVVLVLLLARAVGRRPAGSDVTADAARAAVILGGAYVLAAPYSLPWYDALPWAPLALATAGLDVLLLVRLVVLALAYVPGRVAGMSPRVHDLTLGYRREVAPWLAIALLLWLVVLARRPVSRLLDTEVR